MCCWNIFFQNEENSRNEELEIQLAVVVTQLEQKEKEIQEIKLLASRSSYESRHECKICFEMPIEIINLPCGHAMCCTKCSLNESQCYICSSKIQAKETIRFQ